MAVHPRPRARLAALVAPVLLLAGCGIGPAGSVAPAAAKARSHRPMADPAAGPGTSEAQRPAPDEDQPHELVLSGDLRHLAAGRPDATDAVVELRVVVAGSRSHVTTSVGGQILDQHVVTADAHWLWIPPDLRGAVVDAEWLRLDVAAIEDAGLPLPRHVAAARVPVPAPDDVEIGDLVGGMEVLEVEPLTGHAVRLTMAGVPVPMTLRRRSLPAGTEVELPAGAVDAREVPDLLGG